MEQKIDYKEIIKQLLKNSPDGLTIQEISDKLSITRITSSIALAELRGEDKIIIREIGNAKLHFLKDE